MGKKKPSKYKPGKYQFIVSSDKPIVRIEDLDPKNYPVKVIKPTLNSKGGEITKGADYIKDLIN